MHYTAYLRWGILAGLCIALFIPFVAPPPMGLQLFGNTFFPFITGKNFAFRIIVELILLFYIILAVKDPQYRPKASWLLWSALAFVVWMGLATLFSVDPVKSFWSNFERMEGYIGLLHMFALFVVAGAVVTAAKWWTQLFRVSVVASALMGFYAVLQLFNPDLISSQSGPRVDTTFGNATYLAVYMLIQVFLTLFLLVRDRKSNVAVGLYVVALALQMIALFFTETRGAALGLVGGLIVAAVYIAWRARGGEWALLRKISLGALIGIILLGGLFVSLKDTKFIQHTPMLSRLASISLDDPTTMSRFLYIWPMAIKGGLEKPILGWGQENFSYIFNKNYSPAMYGQEQWFDRAHNQFLDWLVAGGIPAFLLYLSLFVLAAWAIIRSSALSAPEAGVLLGLLAAYGFSNMFVFDNLVSAFYFFLILAFVHSLARYELPRWIMLSKPASDQAVAVVAPIAVIVIIGTMWAANVGGIARAQGLIDAISNATPAGTAKNPADNLEDFKRVLQSGSLGRQESVEQLFQFASNRIVPDSALDPQLKQEFYTFTRAEAERMLAERQNDARLELFMAMFLNQYGQYSESLQYLEQASEHSPNKQQILFQIGLTYLQRGDSAQALPILKKAFDLEPRYDAAAMYYIAGLFYAGRTTEADKLLMERYGTIVHDDDVLLQVYNNTRQFERVVGIWLKRVEKDPNNFDVGVGLANAYFMAGDKEGAIGELQRVKKLRPSEAASIDALITQIQNGTLQPQ